MALFDPNQMNEAVEGFHGLPILKQMGLLIALAASVALGVWVVLWSQQPELTPLYTDLPAKELTDILDMVTQAGIKARGDPDTGTVWVPADKISDIRLKLASKGLPHQMNMGFDGISQDNGFGASKFVETLRFRQALENELARTIGSISNIRKARIHLALPKTSLFVRDQHKPSASVFVDLYAGRALEKGQVDAIINMVASSIPDMSTDSVTVIDQRGKLLTDHNEDEAFRTTHKQLDYTRAIEREYVRRIEEILTPFLGDSKVRAQVTADMDFTITEKTQEMFAPTKNPLVRSEQTHQEHQVGGGDSGGVPGALTNQPPVSGAEAARQEQQSNAGGKASTPAIIGSEDTNKKQSRIFQTRNYELDKTIAYVKQSVGLVKRLSVAVVVDDLKVKDKDGKFKQVHLKDDQLSRITELVREAVGFDKTRGDTVTVVNSSFVEPDFSGDVEMPAIPLWKQPWFWTALKQGVAGIFILVVLFTILKPLLTTLASKTITIRNSVGPSYVPGPAIMDSPDLPILKQEEIPRLPEPSASYGAKMDAIRNMVKDDPGRVAQVVLNWVGDENE